MSFPLTLLAIELLDELVGGVREAAWPLLRADLSLTYVQVGLLTTIPAIVANLVEPPLGILGDTDRRRIIVLAGGVAFAASALLAAVSRSFWPLLLSFAMFFPASGAFVSLSQAALMDWAPGRREQNMTRWELAGGIGAALGPLALAGAMAIGGSWRALYIASAALAAALTLRAGAFPFSRPAAPVDHRGTAGPVAFLQGLRGAWHALRSREVLRWLALLEASDLMLDVLFGFLALYLVDVAGFAPGSAALAVTLWTVTGLVGDLAVIRLLDRVSGISYLRWSAALVIPLFAAFLLAPGFALKLLALAALGLGRAGWYAVLKAQFYAAMPGQSGAAMAVSSATGFVGGLLPLALGAVAQLAGLNVAMWLLLAGPVALLAGLPRGPLGSPPRSIRSPGRAGLAGCAWPTPPSNRGRHWC